MSNLPFYQEQLEFMIEFARHRIEWLNPFFLFLNYFDTPYFYFLLVPVIWFCISYQWGLRIFYWTTVNHLLMIAAKNSFGWPRPSTEVPEIGLLHPDSYGFPSAGAQGAMLLGSLLIYYWRVPAAWAIGIPYILLISFSRLYLGVHFPLDILGGWIFAFLLLVLIIFTKELIERFLTKKGFPFCLLISLAIPLAILMLFPGTAYVMGGAMGIGLGSYLSLRYKLFLPPPSTFTEGVLRSVIGIAMLFFLVLLLPQKGWYLSFIPALFMSLAASPICKWISIKGS